MITWGTGGLCTQQEKIYTNIIRFASKNIGLVGNHTNIIVGSYTKDCPVIPSYVHANIGETSCMLAAGHNFPNMKEAVNQDNYSTFFEYRMDQYSKFGVVEREIKQAKAEFREQIFTIVEDNLSHMI
jgi:creatinine amidohydrolase/Fe(II)-dependent formamide hydrolase-like protein